MPFRDVAGHRHVLAHLSRAAAREMLPPSLLFTGPDGVGKFTAAIALAEVLNCDRPVRHGGGSGTGLFGTADEGPRDLPIDACGGCGPCRRVARAVEGLAEGRRPAFEFFHVLQPDEKGSIKIAVVREIVERSGYRPFEGRRRVVVIDVADALEPDAQQALLKVLEEPPSSTVFVLVTSRPDTLLPTIRSRCPQVRFGPLPTAEIVELLVRKHGCSEDEARGAAAGSGGSVGQALVGLEGGFDEARRLASRILAQLAADPSPTRRLEAARALLEKPGREPSRRGLAGEREVLALRLRAIGSLLRDLQVLASGANDALVANADLDLSRFTRHYTPPRGIDAYAAVDRGLSALDRKVSPKVVADWVALQL